MTPHVPLVPLTILLVLVTLVMVRVPRVTFTTVTLRDLFGRDTTFLSAMHEPTDRAVDITGLLNVSEQCISRSSDKIIESESESATTHRDLSLLRTTHGLPPSVQVSEEGTPRSTFVSFRFGSLGIATSPIDRLVSTESSGDRGGGEEGNSKESTDGGHREGSRRVTKRIWV
jgi:hypothetical protein